jgi:hypothetical protein
MSFPVSFRLPSLGPSGAYWLDDAPDLSCQDSTQEHAVDGPLLSCKQQVGGCHIWMRGRVGFRRVNR